MVLMQSFRAIHEFARIETKMSFFLGHFSLQLYLIIYEHKMSVIII